MRVRARYSMGFPLPLPVWCRGGRKRNWEAHPDPLEGRVAANGPQGRYAPLTRWPYGHPDRRSLLRVGGGGGGGGGGGLGTEGWSFSRT